MKAATVLLAVLAAVWGCLAFGLSGQPRWTLALPPALSLLLIIVAVRGRDPAPVDRRRVRRIVGLWSAVEVAAVLAAVQLLPRSGNTELIVPAIAAIVGLHFLPLARGLANALYYWTGAALIVAAAASLAAAPANRPLLLGLSAAVVLWVSAVALLRRLASP